jgi:signal transduction histidine kinase
MTDMDGSVGHHDRGEAEAKADDLERRIAERTRALEQTDRRLREELSAIGRRLGDEDRADERGRLLAQAEEAVRARDVFLAVASHELRTPLTPLRLNLQLLQRELSARPEDDRLARQVEVALRQVDRLSILAENLLDIARGTMGWRLPIEPHSVDLGDLARDVVARFAPDAARARSVIELRVSTPARARLDPARIGLVLGSLLSNAIKYGAGKPIVVSVSARPGGVRLSVEDQGMGVALDQRERIFGLFERAASERQYGGLGLGLYIARQIVEAHGGRITCSGEAGRGATFTVDLPEDAENGGLVGEREAASTAEPLDPAQEHV